MTARVLAGVSKHTITLFSDLAGCPQNFMREECVPYARLGGTVQHGDADAARAATLVPADSVLLSFLVDKQGNTFVWKDGLFAARVEYGLDSFIGPDSVVYGFAFFDEELCAPVVRVFDASRLRGKCMLGLNCFERFKVLFENLSASARSRSSLVRLHWVWTEGWLHEFVLCKPNETLHGLDCALQCAIRLPELLSPDASYYTIVAPGF
jgi:hypothetical protein